MTVSKRQQEHVNKYISQHYDQIKFTAAKGERERIKAAADRAGVSLSEYIRQAIAERIAKDEDGQV